MNFRFRTPLLAGLLDSARPQWVRTMALHLQTYLRIWLLFWAFCLTGVIITLIILANVGSVDVSIVEFIRHGPLGWFLMVVSAFTVLTQLPTHIAHGMTRRAFARGALAAAGISAVLHVIAGVAATTIEGATYAAMGWHHHVLDAREHAPQVLDSGIGALLLNYTSITVAGSLSGVLIAVGYMRLGAVWGTVGFPAFILPVIGPMLMTTWAPDALPWQPHQPLGAVITIALVLGGTLAVVMLTRTVTTGRFRLWHA